jgi:hypothetical protein
VPKLQNYGVLKWLPRAWQHLGESEAQFELTHLSLSQSYPMIIPLCKASLSQTGQLIRNKSLATLLFEEAVRHKKLQKASTEPSMFCGLLILYFA